ncbi:MAG TPA: hypothetical protein VFD59_11770, partial [Nocardioidaceae bacterium]|nr:hypothetical protein [Nocardioidaceae bacterium]
PEQPHLPPPSSPQYPAPSYGQQPPLQYGGQPHDPQKRPTTVTIAAWLTWGFSALTLAVFALMVLVMLVARDQLLDSLQADSNFAAVNISTDDLMAAMWVMSAVALFWCAASIALAILAYNRLNWARITLVVSASVALLFSLAAFPFGLLHALAAGATIALLFTGGANEWYSRKGDKPAPYAGYPPPQNEPPNDQPSDENQAPPKNVW